MTKNAVVQENSLDLLERVGQSGTDKAAESLSALSGKSIGGFFVHVTVLPIENVPVLMGDPEQTVVAAVLEATGDFSGCFMVVFPLQDAFRLIGILTGTEGKTIEDLGEMELSAISEVGNILASAYLTALDEISGILSQHSPPTVVVDMAAGILTSALLPLHEAGSDIISIEARFGDSSRESWGRMILVPNVEALPRLLEAVGKP
jgi:chemotaxis protein CheC